MFFHHRRASITPLQGNATPHTLEHTLDHRGLVSPKALQRIATLRALGWTIFTAVPDVQTSAEKAPTVIILYPREPMLTDLATVKQFADIQDTAIDPQLSDWITEAVAVITNFVGQPLLTTTFTNHVFDGNDSPTLSLGYRPLSSLTGLQRRASGVGTSATWDTIATSEYELIKGLYILYPVGFQSGLANYRVSFDVGYAAADLPKDIRQVATDMVVLRYRNSYLKDGDARFGVKSGGHVDQDKPIKVTYQDLRPEWADILRPYRYIKGL